MKKVKFISDFNIEPLKKIWGNIDPNYEIFLPSFGLVYQELLAGKETKFDNVIVWTLPQNVLPSFQKALNNEEFDFNEIINEAENFSELIINYSKKCEMLFFCSWHLSKLNNNNNLTEWDVNVGTKYILNKLNIFLVEKFSKCNGIKFLDTEKWIDKKDDLNPPLLWYSAKIPYSNNVFKNSAISIINSIKSLKGDIKKLIIVDLDNTLWGGVVGENGTTGINLGGHDFRGEAYKDFQRELKSLKRKGIQLAICSKNDEGVALDAINSHDEMILKIDDFVSYRINWNNKASNIKSIVEELNIGIDSVVFIDDNPVERDNVRQLLPDVFVPEWPENVLNYVNELNKLMCFDIPKITDEDKNRTKMYLANTKRNKILKEVKGNNLENWLVSLDTQVKVSKLNVKNQTRVLQLFNKTNQLNLSTRRLTDIELFNWLNDEIRELFVFSVADKFGDLGIIGLSSFSLTNKKVEINDFILSCRAMGREIELSMLHFIKKEAIKLGAKEIYATYKPTERNRPTLDVLRNCDFKEKDINLFSTHDLKNKFNKPSSITITYEENR